jgi:hypothetical protein
MCSAAFGQGSQMKQTLFLIGPSDVEGQSSTVIESRNDREITGSANWTGLLPIWPFVAGDASLQAKSIYGLVGIQKIETSTTPSINIFNLVADADASANSLHAIQAMERNLHALRWFNRPHNVLKTSRARLPQTLASIPHCRVPRVFASSARSFDELVAQCSTFDAWPLIIRASGYHSGEHMLVLDSLAGLEPLRELAWLYKGIFLIEFVDTRSADNLYTKTRVIMIDGVPYPRHSIVSNQRFIHAKNRADLMGHDNALCRREERVLADLSELGLPDHGAIFAAIHQRIGLDVFGIDFTVLNGQMLVFEANAVMNFLDQDYGAAGRYRYLEPHVQTLKRALKKMLMTA